MSPTGECERCGAEGTLTQTGDEGWLCTPCRTTDTWCAEEGGLSPLGVAMARELLGELQVEVALEAEKAKKP